MEIWKAIVLGVVQGLTEFLPVSSSGHLVLGKHLLGLTETGIEFEVFVHFGTLLAVFTAFRKDIKDLALVFLRLFTPAFYKDGVRSRYRNDVSLRMLVFIFIGSIPAAIAGLTLESEIESIFSSPRFASGMLLVTAFILALTYFVKRTDNQLKLNNTFIMGLAQALAILPGISRSGSTIGTGLLLKVEKSETARFSFLLAIPAILGATLLKTFDLAQAGISSQQMLELGIGLIAAYISGFLAIETLLAVVRRGKLYLFAPYCLIIGLLGLILL
ncbi:MAG: undecaprenyl-diphosphate phosphatase [candidate division KSB1 bacterium]|nr:undecaprenyl-diphosphate phosphatase [candidate division KSB1 bacterium]